MTSSLCRVVLFPLFAAATVAGAGSGAPKTQVYPHLEQTFNTMLHVDSEANLWTHHYPKNVIPCAWATPGYTREKSIIRNALIGTWGSVAAVRFTWREGFPTTGSKKYVRYRLVPMASSETMPAASRSSTIDRRPDAWARHVACA